MKLIIKRVDRIPLRVGRKFHTDRGLPRGTPWEIKPVEDTAFIRTPDLYWEKPILGLFIFTLFLLSLIYELLQEKLFLINILF